MVSPFSITVELALEAIEKREAHDEDCQHLRTQVAKLREKYRVVLGVSAPRKRKYLLPDDEETNALLDVVDAEPEKPHLVSVQATNQKAFNQRRKWTNSGYLAWTKCVSFGVHHVYAQKVGG